MLCSVCLDTLAMPLKRRRSPDDPADSLSEWGGSRRHHLSFESFQSSVNQKCRLCLEIWDDISHEGEGLLRDISAELGALLTCEITGIFGSEPGGIQGSVSFETPWRRSSTRFNSHMWSYYLDLYLASEVGVQTEGSTIADVDGTGHVCEDAIKIEAEQATQVLKWLRECSESHPECAPFALKRDCLPSRVVEVNGPTAPDVRIVDTRKTPVTGLYTALSYCRGTGPAVKLLSTNLETTMDGISVSSLPKTLRDAISFTRLLGIPYIWIDSLCIIQDSKDDWAIEAVSMASTHGSSYCTLAATHSKDCDGGLFWHKNPTTVKTIVLTSNLQPGFPEPMALFRRGFWNVRTEGELAPLGQRGWVLQERSLSPRTVLFTYDQVLWECHQSRRAQFYPSYLPDENHTGIRWMESKIHNLQKPTTAEEDHRFMTAWDQLVEKYSDCQLTYPTDKLVAIGGIAGHVASLTGEEYLAGLWRRHMPFNLHWRLGKDRGKAPSVYRAPSWSWAALDARALSGYPHLDENPILLIEIISCTVNTLHGSPFGPVTGGELRLRGRLIPIIAYREDTSGPHAIDIWWIGLGELEPGAERVSYSYNGSLCDVEFPAMKPIPRYLLPTFGYRSRGYDNSRMECLILGKVDGDAETYVRFGILVYVMKRWTEAKELKDVVELCIDGDGAEEWLAKGQTIVLV